MISELIELIDKINNNYIKLNKLEKLTDFELNKLYKQDCLNQIFIPNTIEKYKTEISTNEMFIQQLIDKFFQLKKDEIKNVNIISQNLEYENIKNTLSMFSDILQSNFNSKTKKYLFDYFNKYNIILLSIINDKIKIYNEFIKDVYTDCIKNNDYQSCIICFNLKQYMIQPKCKHLICECCYITIKSGPSKCPICRSPEY
jgi:hypothetical protein